MVVRLMGSEAKLCGNAILQLGCSCEIQERRSSRLSLAESDWTDGGHAFAAFCLQSPRSPTSLSFACSSLVLRVLLSNKAEKKVRLVQPAAALYAPAQVFLNGYAMMVSSQYPLLPLACVICNHLKPKVDPLLVVAI